VPGAAIGGGDIDAEALADRISREFADWRGEPTPIPCRRRRAARRARSS
jgi:hypothetical protein